MADPRRFAYPSLLIAILAVSFASIFIRWSDADPLVIAGYRMLFASIILAPFAVWEMRASPPLERKTLSLITVTGLVLAVHFFTFIASLEYTSVASSTILVNCHPLIVGTVSVLVLKESSRRVMLGVLIGFAGVVVIALSGQASGEALGDGLALIGGVMAAIYLLAGRVLRRSLGIFSYAFLVYIIAAAFLFLGMVLAGVPLWPYPLDELLVFLALAVVCTIFGHTVYNWSLKHVPAPVVSTSLLGEPILASMLAFLLLGELPGWTVVLAAPLVLFGIGLTAWGRKPRLGSDMG